MTIIVKRTDEGRTYSIGENTAEAARQAGQAKGDRILAEAARDAATAIAAALSWFNALLWSPTSYLFGVDDGRGFFRLTIDRAGKLWAQTAEFANATVGNLTASAMTALGAKPFGVADERGFAGLALDGDTLKAPKVSGAEVLADDVALRPVAAPALDLGSEVELILLGGQSLSEGLQSNTILARPLSNVLMLSTGLHAVTADYHAADFTGASLVPLLETVQDSSGTPRGQTAMSGIVQSIQEAIERDTGVAPAAQTKRYICLAVGVSGASIEALSRGAGPYSGIQMWNQLIAAVTKVKALCDTAGMHVTCRRMFWMQGESNLGNTTAAYQNKLEAYVADLQTYVKPVLGQSEDIHFFSYQTAQGGSAGAPTIAQAQLAAAVANPLIHVVGGMSNAYRVDGTHINADSEHDCGGQFGRTSYQVIERGTGEGQLVRPLSKKFIGSRGIVYFSVPVPPLLIDAGVRDAVNAGVSLRSAADAVIAIHNVEVRGNAIAFTTVSGANIPADAVVWIGRDPAEDFVGATKGPRVALRDSAGDYAPAFDPLGRNRRVHNWAAIASI